MFRTLAPDWDSYGAAPVTARAVRATRTLLRALADSQAGKLGPKLRPFAVGPLPSGGLQVDWRGPGGELEVDIEPDGTFGYLLVTGVEPNRHFEEAAIASRVQILKLILKVLSG